MGNITRYLGFARVHMSLQRRCPKSYLCVKHRRITVFCADAKSISTIDAVIRSTREFVESRDRRGLSRRILGRNAVWCTRGHMQRENVSRSMIIITIINYCNHYQSVDDDERSNDGTKMPTRQHIFSSVNVKLPNAKRKKNLLSTI